MDLQKMDSQGLARQSVCYIFKQHCKAIKRTTAFYVALEKSREFNFVEPLSDENFAVLVNNILTMFNSHIDTSFRSIDFTVYGNVLQLLNNVTLEEIKPFLDAALVFKNLK